ncbi:hypothetical protein QM565_38060 [Geitlerinema splendidum]|nr:hypothetical protein [Geitlerinema splendidum]
MGKLNSPQLAQRVEALLRLMLKVFLEDAEMIERYNVAFCWGLAVSRVATDAYPERF